MQGLIVFSLAFITVSLAMYILIAGQSFFIPFLIALVIAYLIIAVGEMFGKLQIAGRSMPRFMSFAAAIFLIGGAMYFVGQMVGNNVVTVMETAPIYQAKMQALIQRVFTFFEWPIPDFARKFREFDFSSILTQIVFVMTDVAGRTGMITVYVLFMLLEYHYFDQKIMAVFQTEEGKKSARKMMTKISKQMKSYIVIKTLLSTLTALLSYGVMVFVGVDFADFWAFLIFILNFIPTIGSIIATAFPCLLTLIQFGTLAPFLAVTLMLVSIQFVIGNVIEPRVMGKQFNLSGLVIIIFLTLWGQIWGVIGMLLCVPLLMMLSIILSNFPKMRPIAILLSQTGKLDD